MRHLFKLLALLVTINTLYFSTKADLPPGTLEAIKNNENLEEIVTDDDRGKVCDLKGWGLSSEDIKGMGAALASNTTIREIILADNFLENDCALEIVGIMCANDTLETIDLSENYIGERCITDILNTARKLGKFWEYQKKNGGYYLTRILKKTTPQRRFSLEFPDKNRSKFSKAKKNSEKLSKKQKAQERAQDRFEKESDQGKLYD